MVSLLLDTAFVFEAVLFLQHFSHFDGISGCYGIKTGQYQDSQQSQYGNGCFYGKNHMDTFCGNWNVGGISCECQQTADDQGREETAEFPYKGAGSIDKQQILEKVSPVVVKRLMITTCHKTAFSRSTSRITAEINWISILIRSMAIFPKRLMREGRNGTRIRLTHIWMAEMTARTERLPTTYFM